MKKIIRAGVCLLVFLAAAAGAGLFWLRTSLPPAQAEIKLDGLRAEVRVYRDESGVPHIFAANLEDAAAALGYLHASDRLFQMEMTRRAASGRLAEVLGADLVNYDKKMRALGFAQLAEENYDALSEDARHYLQRYAEGVNAYLSAHRNAWPPEFVLLGFQPEVWRPSDGLLWAKLMSWQLSGDFEDEVFRAGLAKKGWSREKIEALYPPINADAPVTMRPLEWVKNKGTGDREQGTGKSRTANNYPLPPGGAGGGTLVNKQRWPRLFSGVPPLTPPGGREIDGFFTHLPHQASNIYVIGGWRTGSGKPILANDPHLQLQAPILWYLARIKTPEMELKGATAPGLPLFPLGQNGHVAWGFTTSGIDVQDMVFVPADMPVTVRHEIIKVKGGADVAFDARAVDGRPVLSDAMPDVAALTPEGQMALLYTTGLEAHDRTAEALMQINRAQNIGDIEKALPLYTSPPQNMMAADTAGHIAYYAVGARPVRNGYDGFMPAARKTVDAWKSVSSETNPQLVDPPAGVILNANNAQDDGAVRSAAEPYRAMRLEALLKDARGLTAVTASAPMLDIRSVAAVRLMPRLMQAAAQVKMDEALRTALLHWDGAMNADRAEPLIFHFWLQKILAADFGDAAEADISWPREWALEKSAADLSQDAIARAFTETMAELTARYGSDWKDWRWGDVHRAPLAHPVWSKVPLLKQLFSLSVETDGDGTTLQRAAPTRYDGMEAFSDTHGAGYRAAYDLADPALSRFVIAGGESGNVLSPYYGNLVPAWASGQFVSLAGDEKDLAARGKPALVFH